MGPMRWQERTNSHRLYSDLHIYTKAGVHIHAYMLTNKSKDKFILLV